MSEFASRRCAPRKEIGSNAPQYRAFAHGALPGASLCEPPTSRSNRLATALGKGSDVSSHRDEAKNSGRVETVVNMSQRKPCRGNDVLWSRSAGRQRVHHVPHSRETVCLGNVRPLESPGKPGVS